jgi:hypothetical protein
MLCIGKIASLLIHIKPLNQQSARKPEFFNQLCKSFPNALIEADTSSTEPPIQPGLF